MAERKMDSGDSSSGDALEIPQQDWSKFLDDFSSSHELWSATVEVLGNDGDHDVQIGERPLNAIRFDAIRNGNIVVALGAKEDGSEPELTHTIIRPVRLEVAIAGSVTLTIESADGSTSIVHCVNISDRPRTGGIAA